MKRVKIELGRRLYFLLISLVIVAGVLGLAYAYGGTQPSIHGHDAGELDLSGVDFGLGNSDLSTNGYQEFANGLIIQWGKTTTPTRVEWGQQTTTEINFPIEFPNKVMSVQATPLWVSGGYAHMFTSVSEIDLSSFKLIVSGEWDLYANLDGAYWMAIGY